MLVSTSPPRRRTRATSPCSRRLDETPGRREPPPDRRGVVPATTSFPGPCSRRAARRREPGSARSLPVTPRRRRGCRRSCSCSRRGRRCRRRPVGVTSTHREVAVGRKKSCQNVFEPIVERAHGHDGLDGRTRWRSVASSGTSIESGESGGGHAGPGRGARAGGQHERRGHERGRAADEAGRGPRPSSCVDHTLERVGQVHRERRRRRRRAVARVGAEHFAGVAAGVDEIGEIAVGDHRTRGQDVGLDAVLLPDLLEGGQAIR